MGAYSDSIVPRVGGFELSSDAIAAACLSIELCENSQDCTNPKTPWMLGLNPAKNTALFFKPRCGLWSCSPCAEINKNRLVLRILKGSEMLMSFGHAPCFTTLTAHEKLSPAASWSVFRSAWMKLSARMRYRFPDLAYVLIPEPHKTGRWHWHGLIFAGPPERWLKDNARECGFGYMVDSQPARTPRGCAWYASKYSTKGIELQAFKPGQHRYNASRNFPKLPDQDAPPGWTFEVLTKSTDVGGLVEHFQGQGFRVVMAGSKSAWEVVGETR